MRAAQAVDVLRADSPVSIAGEEPVRGGQRAADDQVVAHAGRQRSGDLIEDLAGGDVVGFDHGNVTP
jgi:hypothetical protein